MAVIMDMERVRKVQSEEVAGKLQTEVAYQMRRLRRLSVAEEQIREIIKDAVDLVLNNEPNPYL